MHSIRVSRTTFVDRAVKSFNKLYQLYTNTNGTPATKEDLTIIFNRVINEWSGKVSGLTGVTGHKQGDWFVIRTTAKTSAYQSFATIVNRRFREDIYKYWQNNNQEAPEGFEKGLGEDKSLDVISLIGGREGPPSEGLGFSHDYGQKGPSGKRAQKSNIANTAFLDWMKTLDSGMLEFEADGETVDMATWVMERLDIGWKRIAHPETGKLQWIVTGELAGKNPPGGAEDLGKAWEASLTDKFDKLITSEDFGLLDAEFKASEPFTNQLSSIEVRRLADQYLKLRGYTKGGIKIKVKNLPKKPKKSSRGGKAKSSKSSKQRNTYKIKATVAPGPSMKQERGAGRGASAQGAAQVARLKKYINSRLSAEVRRNMGRPALINRTGRFSNSVQLLSLMEGKNTLMAKYTYLLSPYETFENTGKKRWPLAYNPKKLIAKSIRNLAMGRINQKLTLRRV